MNETQESAFSLLEELHGEELAAVIAFGSDSVGWENVATISGPCEVFADDGPAAEIDVILAKCQALHLPWPQLVNWAWVPFEPLPGAQALELRFDGWRVRFVLVLVRGEPPR